MKINIGPPEHISQFFQARANPWAHKYEPALWNDCSQGAYEATIEIYRSAIDSVGQKFGLNIDRPSMVAGMLAAYSDDNLRLLTGMPIDRVTTMRTKIMRFLNTTAMSTNCYAYALNVRCGFKPGDLLTPGHLKDVGARCSTNMVGKSLTSLFDGLAEDGLSVFNGNPDRDTVPEGFYLAAVLVHQSQYTDMIRDFHFVRYDRDGGCSHKLGHGYVTNLDYTGRMIRDPQKQEIQPGYKYQGCILVPAVLPQQQYQP